MGSMECIKAGSIMNTISNPYIGPRTFTEDERDRFYGREREADELLARVLSEQEIVFYAQSGAGKSSLVNTCLIPELREEGIEVLLGRVGGEAPSGLEVDNIFVFNLLRSLSTSEVNADTLSTGSLSEFLAPASEGRGAKRRALIIDQFEEIFSTHDEAWEKRAVFFKQLARALKADPRLRVVFVMREDFIASMDPYARLLPGRFQVRYYMQRLEYAAALKAVKEPVKGGAFSRPFEAGVAEKLVDDLRSVKVYKSDGAETIEPGQYVEPVQLQVVCYNLWENLPEGGTHIREQDLQDVGNISASFVSASLGKYYATRVKAVAEATQVNERKIREWFTDKLISPTGIRNMVLQERGGKSGGLENNVIQALPDLVRAEMRGGATFYELTHDRLVEPIIENNRQWDSINSSPFRSLAEEWVKSAEDKKENHLLSDQALIAAEQWATEHPNEMTETEKEFLEECYTRQKEKEAKRERAAQQEKLEITQRRLELAEKLKDEQARSALRSQRFSLVAGGLVILALIATGFAITSSMKATSNAEALATEKARAEASAKKAEELAALARAGELSTIALDKSDSELDLALLLGATADSIDPTDNNPQTHSALLSLLQRSSRFRGTIKRDEDILDFQFAPDGRTFATLHKNGIIFWDASTLEPFNNMPLNGHFAGVTALAMSKDGSLIASGASDGSIVIWNAVNRSPLGESFKFRLSAASISSLAFSPNGKILASANWDDSGNVILWDISNPEDPRQLGEMLDIEGNDPGSTTSIAFSPDGNTIASGNRNASITLWNVLTRQRIGDPLEEPHTEGIWSIVFSPDGKTLASGGYDDSVILWDVSDPENPEPGEPLIGENPIDIEVIAISPDGRTLAAGDDSGNITLWNIQTGKSMGEPLNGGTSWVISLAFSLDSKTLAAGSLSNELILWDVKKRTQIGKTLLEHNAQVRGVAFSPDGQRLVSASEDSTLLFWDISRVDRPKIIGESLQGHPGQPISISFSPDGSLLASSDDKSNILFDVRTQAEIGPGKIFGATQNGRILAYQTLERITGEPVIHLRDMMTGEDITDALPGQNPVFSPDGRILVIQTSDTDERSLLNLWDVSDLSHIDELDSPGFGEFRAFSPDSQILAYHTTDQDTGQAFIILWDILNAIKIAEPIPGISPIISLDGKTVVYQTSDSKTGEALISLRNIAEGVETTSIPGNILGSSADGKILIYQSGDGAINVLDTQNADPNSDPILEPIIGKLGRIFSAGQVFAYESEKSDPETGVTSNNLVLINTSTTTQIGETIEVNFVELVQEGQILIYEASDGKINLLNTEQVANLVLEGTVLAVSPDGRLLAYRAFTDNSNNIRLWDLTNNKHLGEPIVGEYLALGADGTTLATRGENNTIIFWDAAKTWSLGEPLLDMTESVSSAALSPDGKTLAFSNADGMTIQDLQNGETIDTLVNEHVGKVGSVVFSPDKTRLVSIGEDGKTLIWDLNTFERLSEPIPGTHASFSLDGNRVAIGDVNTNTITLWDATAGTQQIDELPAGQSATFSPDGRTLAVYDGSTTTTFFDLVDSQVLGEPVQGYVLTSPNSDNFFVVVDGKNNMTTVWEWRTMKPIAEPISGSNPYFAGTNVEVLVVGDSTNYRTTLWNMMTRAEIGETLTGNYYPSFSQDGVYMSAADVESNLTMIWNLETGEQVSSKQGYYNPNFCTDSNTAAVISEAESTITLLNLTTGDERIIEKLGGGEKAFVSPDCKKAVVIGTSVIDNPNETAREIATFWNVENAEQISNMKIEGDSAVFSTDSSKVAVGNRGKQTTTFYDVVESKRIGAVASAGSIYFSPGNSDVLQIYNDNDYSLPTTLWNINTGARFGLETYDWFYSPIFYGTDDDKLVAYNYNGVSIWNTKSTTMIDRLHGHSSPISNMLISPNGKFLASLASDGIVLTGLDNKISTPLINEKFSGELTTRISFSPDSARLTALGLDGTILTWELTGSSPYAANPLDASDNVSTKDRFAFSPDGNFLIYESQRRLIVWEIEKNRIVGNPIELLNCCGAIAFSPDGESMYYNDGGKIFRWDQWNDPDDATTVELFSSGQNNVSSLGLITGPVGPKYLFVTFRDQSDDFVTQIWDLARNSKIGDPMPGSIQIIGSDTQAQELIYKDIDGRLIRWDLNPNTWRDLLCQRAGRNLTRDEWTQNGFTAPYPTNQADAACP